VGLNPTSPIMSNRYISKEDQLVDQSKIDTSAFDKSRWNWPRTAIKCEDTNYHMLAWGVVDNVNQKYHPCFKQLQPPLQGAD
jgi:hypothetical protein